MKSKLPKVLHPVAGRPMILEVLATARPLEPNRCVIVVGHGAEAVQEVIGRDVSFALQLSPLGTGHAVMQARDTLRDSSADTLLVLFGDTPLIQPATLQRALAHHQARGAAVTLLSFLAEDPTGYGRIVRDEAGIVQGIVEHKDASAAQRAIRESNGGIMFFEAPWLWENLDRLTVSPQGEYYLTDMVAMAVSQGRLVEGMIVDEREVMGINNRLQLAEASQILWERRRRHWLLEGVTLVDPNSVWIDAEVTLGADTVIHPNVVLRGRTTVGPNCEIGPHCLLDEATVAEGCRVIQSQIISSSLEAGASVGPFAVVCKGH
ncbi:MAG: bifunctional N-acetylglucosamine-1-phosphate uridyltransferase/glucosamine-1-phosphate acetyltransferase [Ardenticatenales bacterium]|nr:bifunctional N-acetylglucosamine-1-phosphate uridyltransferase/glucosamine-1-phosphate acetyltransferase [Ardenticatenales bacterium]